MLSPKLSTSTTRPRSTARKDSAEESLKARLVEMYLEEENLTVATPEHWDRSSIEMDWLKAGARNEVARRSRQRSIFSISFEQHIQRRVATDRSIHELLCEWINQYASRKKPLAYILGDVPFGELTMAVRPPVLIPRSETEQWVVSLSRKMQSYFQVGRMFHEPNFYASHEIASKAIRSSFKVLDVGTGSGCISNYLAYQNQCVHSVGVDIDQGAIDLARENATSFKVLYPKSAYSRLSHLNPAKYGARGRASFFNLDLFSPTFTKNLKEVSQTLSGFDMIVSNPPYITHSDYQSLPPSVKSWESSIALLGCRPSSLIQTGTFLSRSKRPLGNYGFFTSYRSTSMTPDPFLSWKFAEQSPSTANHPTNQPPALAPQMERIEVIRDDGLDFYRRILVLISTEGLLRPGSPNIHRPRTAGKRLPRLVFEVGHGQARAVQGMMLEQLRGVVERVEIWKDYGGVERVLLGYSGSSA